MSREFTPEPGPAGSMLPVGKGYCSIYPGHFGKDRFFVVRVESDKGVVFEEPVPAPVLAAIVALGMTALNRVGLVPYDIANGDTALIGDQLEAVVKQTPPQ